MRITEFIQDNNNYFKYLNPEMTGGLGKKGTKNEIIELQKWLNAHNYPAGSADGIYGKRTAQAVRKFQKDAGIKVDGDAGPITIKAMMNWYSDTPAKAGQKQPQIIKFQKDKKNKEPKKQEKDTKDIPTNVRVKGKTSWKELSQNDSFTKIYNDMKQTFPGLDDNEFAKMIERESSFDTRALNTSSGASGLFQFIPKTARSLGTSTFKIRRMSADKQLALYSNYMEKWIGAGNTVKGKLALLQAAPAYANAANDTVVYKKNTKAWKNNKGWRPDNGGDITVGSIKNFYKV